MENTDADDSVKVEDSVGNNNTIQGDDDPAAATLTSALRPVTVATTTEEDTAAVEDDKLEKEVSFHDKVQVSVIPPTTAGQTLATIPDDVPMEENMNRGPNDLAASLLEREVDNPSSMAYLYKEGRDTTLKERFFPASYVVRARKRVDIETGASTRREISAQPVWDFKEPMNPVERKVKIGQALTNFEENDRDEDDYGDPQYRMTSRNIQKRKWGHRKEAYLISQYLQWTFRASFWSIIITDFIAFMLICLFWACCIYLGALVSPRCFVVAGTSLNEIENWEENFFFMDAFQLSWTTFSTVGYGIVYPQVNKGSVDARPDCFVFSFMVTLEAFVGVLFAAICGSIIFGKVARIQSIATIEWSSPIVIRYGTGVVEPKPGENNDDDDDSDDEENAEDSDEKDKKGKPDDPNAAPGDGNAKDPLDKSVSSQTDKSTRSNGSRKIVKYPPPVLEFRVINMLSYQHGGEIMNASLNVYASTEASKSMESLQLTEDRRETLSAVSLLKLSKELTQKTAQKTANVLKSATKKTGKAVKRTSEVVSGKKKGSIIQRVNRAIAAPPSTLVETTSAISDQYPTNISTLTSGSSFSETDELEPYNKAKAEELELKRRIAMVSLAAAQQSSKHIAVDEGSGLVPRRIFSKMEIETDTHPFFKRVWNIRHVLNEDSPLLTAKVKHIIHKNHGKWPEDICNPSFIRKNIHFHQIIVSLSGTQNSSGSDVCGMHVYEFQSLNIGYRFAQMLDVDDKGHLYLDVDLLNDVREQRGGGGENIRGFLVDEFGQEIVPDENVPESTEQVEGGIPAIIS